MTASGIVLAVIAWLAALAGVALAFLVSFASGMKTVPSMSVGEMLVGVPLPLLALVIALPGAVAYVRAQRVGRAIGAFGVPAALGALGLVIAVGSWLGQPGGPG